MALDIGGDITDMSICSAHHDPRKAEPHSYDAGKSSRRRGSAVSPRSLPLIQSVPWCLGPHRSYEHTCVKQRPQSRRLSGIMSRDAMFRVLSSDTRDPGILIRVTGLSQGGLKAHKGVRSE